MEKLSNIFFCLFLFSLPFYFETGIGIFIPAIILIIALPFILMRFEFSKVVGYFAAYLLLGLAFLLVNGFATIDLKAFANRFGAIFLFMLAYAAGRFSYQERQFDILMLSYRVCMVYAIYAAFSYMLGYQSYLVPGTGGPNNLGPLGLLRCGTFIEGNYFGTYLALLALVLYSRRKSLWGVALASLIPISPGPMLLIGYLIFRDYLVARKRVMAMVLTVVSAALAYIAFNLGSLTQWMFQTMGDATSPLERAEFVRAGLAMWVDHPILGVGYGQFGERLASYTIMPHILGRISIYGFRYISNNNIAEILSEQGLVGIIVYFCILATVARVKIRNLNRSEIYGFFLVLGMTMPTFFQVLVGAMLGIMASGEGHGGAFTTAGGDMVAGSEC